MLAAPSLLLVRWQLLPPAPFVLDLGDSSVSASHFYGVEAAPDRKFRWSREMSAVSLPALASSVTISITLDPARAAGQPLPVVRLRVGDRQVGELASQAGWQTYATNTGPGLSPDVRLVVESGTFYPGVADRRLLGVAVSQIAVASAPNRFGLIFPPLLLLSLAALTPALGLFLAAILRIATEKRYTWLLLLALALIPVVFSLALTQDY
ncbi:MAG TPA: hypothetical protein VFH60_04525, partial [Chloroflexia bacterium]|nr:hypothetical protein [Chloroflexia bacterium]